MGGGALQKDEFQLNIQKSFELLEHSKNGVSDLRQKHSSTSIKNTGEKCCLEDEVCSARTRVSKCDLARTQLATSRTYQYDMDIVLDCWWFSSAPCHFALSSKVAKYLHTCPRMLSTTRPGRGQCGVQGEHAPAPSWFSSTTYANLEVLVG